MFDLACEHSTHAEVNLKNSKKKFEQVNPDTRIPPQRIQREFCKTMACSPADDYVLHHDPE